MSTNSIVGIKTDEHPFRGRYVHWDGYPDGVGMALAEIVRRDGFSKAVTMLTLEHTAWSQIRPDKPEMTSDNDIVVPGYGIAYDDPDRWYDEQDNTGAEWAYAITPDVIEVWEKPFRTNTWTRRPKLDISTHGGWYLEALNPSAGRRFGPYADEQAAVSARSSLELPAKDWKLTYQGK